jgi:hypothetical protein
MSIELERCREVMCFVAENEASVDEAHASHKTEILREQRTEDLEDRDLTSAWQVIMEGRRMGTTR